MKRVTITVDVPILRCARCHKTEPIKPSLIQFGRDPRCLDTWQVTGYGYPDGWRVWRWPAGDESASCGDCWPEIERRCGMFLEQLSAP